MSPRPEYMRLRRLLHDPLHRFSDLATSTFTQEIEKDLLIALSQVLRQVKQLVDELDSDEEELLASTAFDGEFVTDATAELDNRHCLAIIISDLMFLLTANSQYAQHLVGNTLVAISEFLLALDGDWDEFMQLLCLCLDLAICNILKSSPDSAFEARYIDFNPSIRSSLELKLKCANWSVVAAISRVMRNIQKCLKQDVDEKCMKTYLDSVSSLLINFPWDLLREIYVGHNTNCLNGLTEDDLLKIEDFQLREMTTFFGYCIQLLCSLVTQSSSLEVDFSPMIWRIVNLVPELTLWCQVEVQSPYHVRISHYFRHKVLMLMVKVSSIIRIGPTICKTWIHLLHEYFQDLLLQPISGGKLDQDGFLEGSPFCTSIFDAKQHNIPSFHLQRLAILIFLKCSLNLVGLEGGSVEQECMHENLKHISSSDLNLESEICSDNSIGLTELHKWLQLHIHADILLNDDLYFERCVRFTLSFIQLFMQEDDILFEMLLQLFHVPSFFQERQVVKDEPHAEVKNRLAADLFNPIHLFHLFLAEISYDHQVLLDYLISKDTGSICAEYLLRSLRIICNFWSLFVEFPGVKDDSGQLCVKRRKILADSRDIKGAIYPAPLKEGGAPSLETGCKEGHAHGNSSRTNFKRQFVAARDCLASLTTSIDSLNKKGLFPYNPQVLLRRLMKFQELSFQQ
ncbi:hypothetical protein AAHA92_27623 [Salvia divinorum]|uniref:Protein Lines C-terminal domain-containing protein n=1 Tax=Salvia divinorum TaxID=28513 RepID=A0ABD1G7F9_SALDI